MVYTINRCLQVKRGILQINQVKRGILQINQYLQVKRRLLQINQYLQDVVTATASMPTVNASLTTIGYSGEGREIKVIKVCNSSKVIIFSWFLKCGVTSKDLSSYVTSTCLYVCLYRSLEKMASPAPRCLLTVGSTPENG